MKSWKQFVECKLKNIEDMEEKLGRDLDGDNEKGESKAHKRKVLGKVAKAEEEEEDDDMEDDDE